MFSSFRPLNACLSQAFPVFEFRVLRGLTLIPKTDTQKIRSKLLIIFAEDSCASFILLGNILTIVFMVLLLFVLNFHEMIS